MRGDLVEAFDALVNGLVDQQAMADDWWQAPAEEIRAALRALRDASVREVWREYTPNGEADIKEK